MGEALHIDVNKIPPEVGECIGREFYWLMTDFLSQPGARKKLDEWKRTHGLEERERNNAEYE